ncbi:MAG: 16S rRNA (adenine(1518)-N(6)/adenine(1519)-N(6))-dimethyltransferase RsmA [Pseudomonadota bacterium]
MQAAIAALPALREVVRGADVTPLKSLGQHFIFDLNLTNKIAASARPPGADRDAPLRGVTVVEVGPGPGGLTRSLLSAGAIVIAVEADRRALAALAPLQEAAAGRLTLHHGDALEVDWTNLAPKGSAICANLPYNIATPLLVGWLADGAWPPWWSSATIMVQKEVAGRIAAAPGAEGYGRLAVLTAARANASVLFDVAPSAFVPPPKVWSSVVRIDPAQRHGDIPMAALQTVTKAAFGQRRKMLRSSLKGLGDPLALLRAADLSPDERAERVSVERFIALADAFNARKH